MSLVSSALGFRVCARREPTVPTRFVGLGSYRAGLYGTAAPGSCVTSPAIPVRRSGLASPGGPLRLLVFQLLEMLARWHMCGHNRASACRLRNCNTSERFAPAPVARRVGTTSNLP